MTREKTLDRIEHRARVYKLLSDCYLSPDVKAMERMHELSGLLDGLHSGLRLEIPDDVIGADELRLEHARLFIGPFSLLVPPYGSMYLDQEEHLMGGSTQDVHRWYLAEGLETAIKEMDDHICIQLEFLYLLVYRELMAEQDGSPATELAAQFRSKQREFLESHLGRWIASFEAKVLKHAELAYYSTLATATRAFITADLQELRLNSSN